MVARASGRRTKIQRKQNPPLASLWKRRKRCYAPVGFCLDGQLDSLASIPSTETRESTTAQRHRSSSASQTKSQPIWLGEPIIPDQRPREGGEYERQGLRWREAQRAKGASRHPATERFPWTKTHQISSAASAAGVDQTSVQGLLSLGDAKMEGQATRLGQVQPTLPSQPPLEPMASPASSEACRGPKLRHVPLTPP